MKKPKIIMTILKEDTGYSATSKVNEIFIATQGETFEELKEMVLDAVNLAFEDFGFTYTIDEIHFKYDLESFFDFYKVINAKALSERIGMSQSLLAQYTNGIKKPSPSQTKRILKGVQQIGRELSDVRFLL
jgi:predicted RNase H-like HicB family nuclease